MNETHGLEPLMHRYANGEDGSFGALYTLLAPRLFSFCVRLAGPGTEAEDVFQEAFLKLHRARASYSRDRPVLPWAFAIVRSVFLDRLRAKRRRPEDLVTSDDSGASLDALAGDIRSPESNVRAYALSKAIQDELLRMSEVNRAAYILIREEGMSPGEAASILGTTSGAAKVRAHRATESIRSALARSGWEGGSA